MFAPLDNIAILVDKSRFLLENTERLACLVELALHGIYGKGDAKLISSIFLVAKSQIITAAFFNNLQQTFYIAHRPIGSHEL